MDHWILVRSVLSHPIVHLPSIDHTLRSLDCSKPTDHQHHMNRGRKNELGPGPPCVPPCAMLGHAGLGRPMDQKNYFSFFFFRVVHFAFFHGFCIRDWIQGATSNMILYQKPPEIFPIFQWDFSGILLQTIPKLESCSTWIVFIFAWSLLVHAPLIQEKSATQYRTQIWYILFSSQFIFLLLRDVLTWLQLLPKIFIRRDCAWLRSSVQVCVTLQSLPCMHQIRQQEKASWTELSFKFNVVV